MDVTTALDLLDWKRRVFALYAAIRKHGDASVAWSEWRAARDRLFASHPQSPLTPTARAGFRGLELFEYDPAFRTLAEIEPVEPRAYEIPTSDGTTMHFTRVGNARFEVNGSSARLEIYWLTGYGGGLFVPFRDTTSGVETYGAGRYLLDTIKGADLGVVDGKLVFDFNFAYNPSCAYDPRWLCPLPPPANRLDVAVTAGERAPDAALLPT